MYVLPPSGVENVYGADIVKSGLGIWAIERDLQITLNKI